MNRFRVLLNRQNGIALVVLLLCFLVCWWLVRQPDVNLFTPEDFRRSVKQLGFWGPFMGSAFTVEMPMAIALAVVFLIVLIVLPWGIKRYNRLEMRDVIRLE